MPRQIFSWSSELDPAFRHGVLAAGVIHCCSVAVMNATAMSSGTGISEQDNS